MLIPLSPHLSLVYKGGYLDNGDDEEDEGEDGDTEKDGGEGEADDVGEDEEEGGHQPGEQAPPGS